MQSQPQHFFVSTLGDAQRINGRNPHGITTINQLLLCRAGTTPDAVAVGVAVPPQGGGGGGDGKWGTLVYTYSQLLRVTTAAAHRLSALLPPAEAFPGIDDGPTVAILSESSLNMLLCFLGLIRMGYTVLLIAPQCDSQAIRHLLKCTSSRMLLYSPRFTDLASSVAPICAYKPLPPHEDQDVCFPHDWWPTPSFVDSSTIAYIHHTSGTTTGLPTPIPQAHASATLHLPCLVPETPVSTLMTTPLYHGGVADLMRSMMSCSMIWLFPPTVPITAQNILRAIYAADERLPGTPVKLFTGVPYIQKMCLEDGECLAALRKMDIVSYGGAQLPERVGNALVENGVNLVSRFGSTECGFLMSSFRDFATDKAWDYLRVPSDTRCLSFEPRDDGSRELVVLSGWPHMAKRNRPDGSFSTSDLFKPHPSIPRAYKYSTRNDSTVVLINGKKFDPLPIEDGLKQLDIIEEAMVFGQNKESPGILIFPSHPRAFESRPNQQLLATLESVNAKLPSYARIVPQLVIYIEYGRDWPKSSKGTALRSKTEEVFWKEIEQARQRYDNPSMSNEAKVGTGDLGVLEQVVAAVLEQVVGRRLGPDEDFFMAGVDSIMATGIRRALLNKVDLKKPLPANAVFEQRTIKNLAHFLTTGDQMDTEKRFELDVMREMVGHIGEGGGGGSIDKPQVVLLTGATGALGAHILHALFQLKVKKIICLCRAESAPEATNRLFDSLKRRRLPIAWSRETVVQACVSSFSQKQLGLPDSVYSQLVSEVTVVIHAAWPVNFLAPLLSFGSALAGTQNLLELANTGIKKRLFFCSSTASVIRAPSPIREETSSNPEHASPLGYSRSKWVAEGIVRRGGGEVVRLGQLSGDTRAGIWNPEEGWPMLLNTVKQVRCLPDLKEKVQWLPLDIAAQAIVRIALRRGAHEKKVWHVLNCRAIEWDKVLDAVDSCCGKVPRVPPQEWVRLLEQEEKMGGTVKLLGLWKDTYGTQEAVMDAPKPVFEVRNTDSVYPGFATGMIIDEPYLHRVFEALALRDRGVAVPN